MGTELSPPAAHPQVSLQAFGRHTCAHGFEKSWISAFHRRINGMEYAVPIGREIQSFTIFKASIRICLSSEQPCTVLTVLVLLLLATFS